jgi:signal peptidase I
VDSSFLKTVLWIAGILGAVILLLYLFVFDTWVIPNDDVALAAAVEPTLTPDDRILTRRGSPPKLGELARCIMPDGSGKFVIGRAFGYPGDNVVIDNERVSVNGKNLPARFQCGVVTVTQPVTLEKVALTCSTEDNGAFTYNVLLHPEYREGQRVAKVEPGKIYLVSDNRHIHLDSRDFGQVDATTCEHVVFRLWGESFTDGKRRFTVLW